MKTRIMFRIRIEVKKRWIRVRFKVKSCIRIQIRRKVLVYTVEHERHGGGGGGVKYDINDNKKEKKHGPLSKKSWMKGWIMYLWCCPHS